MTLDAAARTPARGDRPTRHIAYIDGLRAVAVLSVIAYHLRESWLPGGFLGVDVFFVISGFVVSQSVADRERQGLGSFLAYFYARRAQRILPALIVCLLITTAATTAFIPPAWGGLALERTGLYAFFGLGNVYLALNRENYFSPTLDYNPFMHTWSLGVEEQFYVIFPLLFFAWTLGGRWRSAATWLAAISLVASYAWARHVAAHDATAAFFFVGSRLWELAAGVALFQFVHRHLQQPTGARRLLAWGGAFLLAYTLTTGRISSFPAPHPLLSVVATCAIIAGLHGDERRSPLVAALSSRPMLWIGRVSYSLYLWHWPVFTLMRWTCGLESAPQMVAAVGATFALAAISNRYVEQPTRYSRTLARLPRIAVVACALVTVGLGWTLAKGLSDARAILSPSIVTRNLADWHSDPITTVPDRPGCSLQVLGEMIGDAKKVSIISYARTGCPDPHERPPRIIVMGDSHAQALRRMLSRHVLETGAEVVFYQNDGCTFASLQPDREGGPCPAGATAALSHVMAHHRQGDILLLAALRLSRWADHFSYPDEARAWASMTGEHAWKKRRHATEDLIRAVGPVVQRGFRIVLLAPTPILRATPYRCADWFNRSNPACSKGLSVPRSDLLRYRQQVIDAFALIAKQLPATYVWDPFPTLCPGTTCGAYLDGHPVLIDGDHMTGYANMLLLPEFESFIAALPKVADRSGDVIMREAD